MTRFGDGTKARTEKKKKQGVSHEVSGITLRFPKLLLKCGGKDEKLREAELREKITDHSSACYR